MIRGILRAVLVVVLVFVLLRLCFKLVAMALPIALTLGAIVLLYHLIRRLTVKDSSGGAAPEEPAAPKPRWRVKLDRIEQRIESLETILADRVRR